jgi:hypothetical protein
MNAVNDGIFSSTTCTLKRTGAFLSAPNAELVMLATCVYATRSVLPQVDTARLPTAFTSVHLYVNTFLWGMGTESLRKTCERIALSISSHVRSLRYS